MDVEVFLRRWARASILSTAVLSGLIFLGWFFGWSCFIVLRKVYILPAPVTAVLFFFLSIVFFARFSLKDSFPAKIFAFLVVFYVFIISFAMLCRNLGFVDFDTERNIFFLPARFFIEQSYRMATLSLFNFSLLSLSLLFFVVSEKNQEKIRFVSSVFAFAVTAVGVAVFLGYIYGTPVLVQHYKYFFSPMALLTSLIFIFFGTGIMAVLGISSWPLKFFVESSVRARLMKIFLPLIIFVVFFYGWHEAINAGGRFNPALFSSFMAVLSSILAYILVSIRAQGLSLELKKAEEARIKVIKDFELIFNLSPDPICIINKERFIRCNPAFEKVLGYTQKELLTRPYLDFVHPEDREKTIVGSGQVFCNGALPLFLQRYIVKDGTIRWLEWMASFDMSSGLFYAVARDVTMRKKMETERILIETRFKELFDNMPGGAVVYEAAEGHEDFIIKDFNKAAETIEKIKKETVIGKSILDVFPGVKEFGLFDVLVKVSKTGFPEHHSVGFYKDKRISGWRDNRVYRLPCGDVVAVYDDVTEQKRMEMMFRELNKCFLGFVSDFNKNLEEIAKAAGVLLEASCALYNRLEGDLLFTVSGWNIPSDFLRKDEAKGHVCFDCLRNNSEAPLVVREIEKSLYHRTDSNIAKYGIRTYGGHPVVVRGKPVGVLCVLYKTDRELKPYELEVLAILAKVIGVEEERRETEERKKELIIDKAKQEGERLKSEEIKKAYEELKKTQLQLIQSEKLSSIGQLAAGVAHELNSPLDGLMSLLRSYKNKTAENSMEKKEFTVMLDAAEHMAHIVKNFVSFAGKSKDEFVELNFNDIIDATLFFASYLLTRKGVRAIREYDYNLLKVLGEKNHLQQVVLNLLTNAVDVMPGGGDIVIRTKNSGDGAFVIAEFIDTGKGISSDVMTKIFDPFFTTKEAGKGMGLGLFIVHEVMKNHGGSVSVESFLGQGTAVTIKLPVLRVR